MAKSKKAQAGESPEKADAVRRTSRASKGSGKTHSTAGASAGVPMIDTNLAAQSAARMLLARASQSQGQSQAPSAEPHSESSAFKQLKESLNKPHLAGMNSVLNSTATPGTGKHNLPANLKQVGRNQTFSADVTRSGVPRRTPG